MVILNKTATDANEIKTQRITLSLRFPLMKRGVQVRSPVKDPGIGGMPGSAKQNSWGENRSCLVVFLLIVISKAALTWINGSSLDDVTIF
jgi:hypothetical protein